MKNLIISVLLVVIINMSKGDWGISEYLIPAYNLIMVLLFDKVIVEFERAIYLIKRERRRYGR